MVLRAVHVRFMFSSIGDLNHVYLFVYLFIHVFIQIILVFIEGIDFL